MTCHRYLCASLALVLVACGSQPKAPVSVIAPDAPWTCVGDVDRTWRCARGQAPDIEQPQPIEDTASAAEDQPISTEQLQELLISEPIEIATAQGSGEFADSSGQIVAAGNEAGQGPDTETGESNAGDEQLVLDTPDNYYALQVVAANSADAVARYFEATAANAAHASASALNLRTWSQERYWYVGIAGLYPDYASAAAAARTLPASAAPWIRPVKGLKQAILAAGQP